MRFAIEDSTVGGLRELLHNPRRYYSRLEDHLSFIPEGGLIWQRSLQLRLPTAANTSTPATGSYAVPLGMFLRRRLGDLEISGSDGRRIPVLSRHEHGEVLTAAILQRYLAETPEPSYDSVITGLAPDRYRADWIPQSRDEARSALKYVVYQLFTADRLSTPQVEGLSQRASLHLWNFYLYSEPFDSAKAGQRVSELFDYLKTIGGITYYLVWVHGSPGETLTVSLRYTTRDPWLRSEWFAQLPRFSRAKSETAKRRRFGQFRSDVYARAALAPTEYKLRLPASDHAASYYFTVKSPDEAQLEFMAWGTEHSLTSHSSFASSAPGFNLYNGDRLASPFSNPRPAPVRPAEETSAPEHDFLDRGSHEDGRRITSADVGNGPDQTSPDYSTPRKLPEPPPLPDDVPDPTTKVIGICSSIRFYMRPETAEHKQLAVGALLGLVISLLFTVGAFPANGPSLSLTGSSWFTGWLTLTPVAFMAFAARNQTHYYADVTKILRASIWAYLSLGLVFVLAVTTHLGSRAPHPLRWLFHDELGYILFASISAALFVWYAALGSTVQDHVKRYVQSSCENSDTARFSPVEYYVMGLRSTLDAIVIYVGGVTILTGLFVAGLYAGSLTVFRVTLTRWWLIASWLAILALWSAIMQLAARTMLRARERSTQPQEISSPA